MTPRAYTVTVACGRTTLRTEGGNALATVDRELAAPDLVALLGTQEPGKLIPVPMLPMAPAPNRWLERLALIAVTAVLVYNYGPTVMWFLMDTSDHVSLYYGSPP